ncbi:UPF0193 protein EVG1 isoform X2 [Protopterus annectens]|uniref:UPF0193 protein EVG1 isoform X2 n=1 Tax=Protopterus annectens TaxID=7888 RepID=UPI001CF97958|nr:UPF0193 protein EVG1 isoform X2 [Protopterus annectens]
MSGTVKGGSVPVGSGFWNSPGAGQYSKETQELLKEGSSLPLQCNATSSSMKESAPSPVKPSRVVTVSCKPQLRPAEYCRAGDAYLREKFKPKPTRDLEKEKQRLQRILAMGKDDQEPKAKQQTIEKQKEDVTETDRFEELTNEIKERQEFLAEMESLGQGKKYRGIIYTEISQKIREMEEIDKKKTAELKNMIESHCQQKQSNSFI